MIWPHWPHWPYGMPGLSGSSLALGIALLVLLALWIDARWGEPPVTLHPVVWMGNYLQVCGRVTVRCPPALAFVLGALAWWLGAAVTGALAFALQRLGVGSVAAWCRAPAWDSAVGALLLVMLLAGLLKSMLAWRMLRDEVGAVEVGLRQSLGAGRERLALLVSRDTANLSESEVRESAIETLAENLNDSVVAPLFWFVLLGLPGAAVYRFANTADAMWGYRGRWEWAGKWAARADDVLSWLPARLTAFLLMLVFRLQQALTVRPEPVEGSWLAQLRQEARRTPSPNSGWPMAAMALVLDVRLGKPGAYVLHAPGRAPEAADTQLAASLASKVIMALCLCAFIAIILIASEGASWCAS